MDSTVHPVSHPILSCTQSLDWESELLTTETEAWSAMREAGKKLAEGIRDAHQMTGFPQGNLAVLALVGKGHNGGDALIALRELGSIDSYLGSVVLILASSVSELKPHTRRALEELEATMSPEIITWPNPDAANLLANGKFDICIDGLLGMQFRPPLRGASKEIVQAVNVSDSIRMRVAVDLPSGEGDESDKDPFQADFTFATGILKRPLLGAKSAGVVRYLDIGFFEKDTDSLGRVITDRILDPLRDLRSATSEKRQFGHLAILAGSRSMPGALAMCVRSALQSGVGLVTVFAPESIVAHLACSLPEAMWKPWPETPEGGLALEGLWQIKTIQEKASCLLCGPGMGTESEVRTLLRELGREWRKPVVLDADALNPEIVDSFSTNSEGRLIVTPHDGELKRLRGDGDTSDSAVLDYAKSKGLTLIKKAGHTRVSDGKTLFVNFGGNGVLSRGGSGDLLAGLVAGLLAQEGSDALQAACRGVYWHGKAADLLAREKGQVAVRTTDLLDYLSPALRSF